MRFELLFAMISSGIIAPLMLMAGGFLLAVGGAAFLFWRRRKSANVESEIEETVEIEDNLVDGAETAETPASAPVKTGRRRSLVSGAERDEGTPSGELPLEEAEFIEYEEAAEEVDTKVRAEIEDGSENQPDEVPDPEAVADEPEAEEAKEPSEPDTAEDNTEATNEHATEAPITLPTRAEQKDEPVSTEISAALMRPIVFRQFTPQSPGKDGLSFYGGRPIGPENFQWPRGRGAEGGPPLTFIMQWDCAQLSEQDATGLLPQDGVLYCFLNLDWGNDEESVEGHSFIHHSGPTDSWAEIDPPEDARPVFGTEGAWQMNGCTNEVDNAEDYVPSLMPRFPFEPIAFDYPMPETETEAEGSLFWAEEHCAEAVLAAQKSGTQGGGNIRDIDAPEKPFARPFPSFPHDFGAIRVLSAKVIEALRHPEQRVAKEEFPDLTDEERQKQFETWREEAKELYQLGCQRPLGHPVEQAISDDIWQWVEDRKAIIDIGFYRIVEESIDLSLGVASEALGSVPAELIEQVMQAHAFADEYMTDEICDPEKHGSFADWSKLKEEGKLDRVRRVHSPTPEHMFGPPSYVQGHVEELIDDHLLLLELPGYSGPEHHFGESVLQYLIKPEDLAAGRFEQVKSVVSSY